MGIIRKTKDGKESMDHGGDASGWGRTGQQEMKGGSAAFNGLGVRKGACC